MDTSQVATKNDLSSLKVDLSADILFVRRELKTDIKILKEELRHFRADNQTKLNKLQATLDSFIAKIDDLSTDNTVGTDQTRELQMRVDNHEERLQQIESAKHAV